MLCLAPVEIRTSYSVFKPGLRLGRFALGIVQLAHEGGSITPFSPSLSNIGGYRTRGPAYLVS